MMIAPALGSGAGGSASGAIDSSCAQASTSARSTTVRPARAATNGALAADTQTTLGVASSSTCSRSDVRYSTLTGHHDRAGPQRAQVGVHEAGPVLGVDRQPVAGAQAGFAQAGGDSQRRVAQRGVRDVVQRQRVGAGGGVRVERVENGANHAPAFAARGAETAATRSAGPPARSIADRDAELAGHYPKYLWNQASVRVQASAAALGTYDARVSSKNACPASS